MRNTVNRYFGVYGLVISEGQVLLVRKTRGPYSGLLDMPGGAPEPLEADRYETLRREFAEETGLVIEASGPWHNFLFRVTHDAQGQPIEFEHAGVWTIATAKLGEMVSTEISSLDTGGTIWIPLQDWRMRTDLSSLARLVLSGAGH